MEKLGYKSIGRSRNNVRVVYDPIRSHATTHLEDTPQLAALIAEIVSSMDLTGQRIATQVDMGRIVGTDDVVRVGPDDEIVYGVRKNREDEGLVPFVKGRAGSPTSYVAIQLAPLSDTTYELLSAWVGMFDPENDEPFPQSTNATANSVQFWSERAFIYGSQEILQGTETNVAPW